MATTVTNNMTNYILCRLCFSRPRFSTDYTTLSFSRSFHRAVCFICDGEYVWWKRLSVCEIGILTGNLKKEGEKDADKT